MPLATFEDFGPHLDMRTILATVWRWDVPHLLKRFSAHVGRQILPVPVDLSRERYNGAWVSAPRFEIVVYESHTLRCHQYHIVLHETSHILLGHPTVTFGEQQAQQFLKNPCAEFLAPFVEMLKRQEEDVRAAREYEAESLAALLQKEIIRRGNVQTLTGTDLKIPAWSDVSQGLWNLLD